MQITLIIIEQEYEDDQYIICTAWPGLHDKLLEEWHESNPDAINTAVRTEQLTVQGV